MISRLLFSTRQNISKIHQKVIIYSVSSLPKFLLYPNEDTSKNKKGNKRGGKNGGFSSSINISQCGIYYSSDGFGGGIHLLTFLWIWYGMISVFGRVVLVDDWLGWTS